ncbi:MAG: hypothetical protein WCJ49_09260 [Deltaproteobacteria bacterium]
MPAKSEAMLDPYRRAVLTHMVERQRANYGAPCTGSGRRTGRRDRRPRRRPPHAARRRCSSSPCRPCRPQAWTNSPMLRSMVLLWSTLQKRSNVVARERESEGCWKPGAAQEKSQPST